MCKACTHWDTPQSSHTLKLLFVRALHKCLLPTVPLFHSFLLSFNGLLNPRPSRPLWIKPLWDNRRAMLRCCVCLAWISGLISAWMERLKWKAQQEPPVNGERVLAGASRLYRLNLHPLFYILNSLKLRRTFVECRGGKNWLSFFLYIYTHSTETIVLYKRGYLACVNAFRKLDLT